MFGRGDFNYAKITSPSTPFHRTRGSRELQRWPLSGRDPHAGLDVEAGVTPPLGGKSLYWRMDEVARNLHFLLTNDGWLLRPATAAAMFEPQLGGLSRETAG
ncbi:hypothetical protein LX32DRAFT_697026 [Colletotrichum zoysiae]|uniref:Uncharacterized protein n=1 Tax=Colletotrichum zoysiae TaxID=1216348 RepID=A0AAD9LXN0_9PEZI|nr:hypothetical protein LX32DRAFT_697026 [Colletotrichum zoysiae]